MSTAFDNARASRVTIAGKLLLLSWPLVLLISLLFAIGFAMLFSAAGGKVEPWAGRQAVRFAIGLCLMLGVALVDIRFWFRHAYSYYGFVLLLLLVVEIAGDIGMGARRWIDFGPVSLQPSEMMKVGIVLALARYFHAMDEARANRLPSLVPPLVLIAVPAALIVRQPDLGTTITVVLCGTAMLFLAGVAIWKFVVVGLAGAGLVPVVWQFLREYQRQRVLTFLDPSRDPLGAGYHITQSKIALGSGGIAGKGFLDGTQSHLNFLPEKQTDFIFTMLAEEFGLIGSLTLLMLFLVVIFYALLIALRSRNQFGRLYAAGFAATLFIYVFINTAMVMGLLPVVGVPLPFISFGGTHLWTVLFGFGLLLSVSIHRHTEIGRLGYAD
ncbi:MAG: rod shape-determining protein RodA [Alphaproteobacteria bacterium]|nr:rod shape-determining protein RodA [Alphaproteobacteria bacterium]